MFGISDGVIIKYASGIFLSTIERMSETAILMYLVQISVMFVCGQL